MNKFNRPASPLWETTDHVLRTAVLQQSSETTTSNLSLHKIFIFVFRKLGIIFSAKIEFLSSAVTILISDPRQIKDDAIDGEARNFGETQ